MKIEMEKGKEKIKKKKLLGRGMEEWKGWVVSCNRLRMQEMKRG